MIPFKSIVFSLLIFFTAKASEATCGQALDHANPDTYLKYQAELKSVDVQATYYNMEPDYKCCDMEQSMAHH